MSRLDKLMKMLEAEPTDSFVLYGIAQELANAEKFSEAVQYYDRCLGADPAYLYAYYHKAAAQGELRDHAGAAATLQTGMKAARTAGDAKALSEMQTLLDSLT